ncbi:uncharacterized protein LOC101896675 [Musca domestica]|uniref:Uncharacterized protein LOC101896675 n=1 Tax=Musca domestica TaxID=7370 RepID=A0A9J7DD88_MUSDO|nr:uncharacterized protein LOC101896675 [Musca domestica]
MSSIRRVFNKDWTNESWAKGWLKSIREAPVAQQSTTKTSWCSACNLSLESHKKDLRKHSETKRHKNNMAIIHTYPSLSDCGVVPISNTSKILDIKLAVFVAKHTAIASIDHLSELLKTAATHSNPFENIKLHRTKCSAIIKSVVGPTIIEELV